MNKKKLIELEDVSLSDGTKEYVKAYKLADFAAGIVSKEMEVFWGDDVIDEMSKKLFHTLDEFQNEILHLMALAIDCNLKEDVNCTEI